MRWQRLVHRLTLLAVWSLLLTPVVGCTSTPEVDVTGPLYVTRVAQGLQFTEGPVMDDQGRVCFTDLPTRTVQRYDPRTGKVEVLRKDSGGANGLALDSHGRLVMCESRTRQVTRLDGAKVTVLADRYQGHRFNSPNDLCLDARGGVYFTDPRYGNRDNMELEHEAVYYLPPPAPGSGPLASGASGASGGVRCVVDDLIQPNGITLSDDGSTLYVADFVAKKIYAYAVAADGSVSGERQAAALRGNWDGGPDGIKVDAHGRIFAAGQGGVWIFAPDGSPLRFILMPEKTTNLALADRAGQTFYVTASTALYRISFSGPPPATQPAQPTATPPRGGRR